MCDKYIKTAEEENNKVHEDILTCEETVFFKYLDGEHDGFNNDEHDNEDAYREHLYGEFKRSFWNYLHSIIFGADAYRAFKQQKDYLLNKLIKPYTVTVEAAFRRIKVIVSLMAQFPPPSSRGKQATQQQWETFDEELKSIPTSLKREMRYNLLPENYHDCMSSAKFMAEAQKCETLDAKERQKMEQAKEALLKRKKQSDSDSVSTLSRSQQSKNQQSNKAKIHKKATPAGVARMCELCKMSGAPEFVYTSHNTANCKKRAEYARKLSGSAGHRQTAGREAHKAEKSLRREVKLLSRQVKRLKTGKRSKKSTSDDDSSLSGSDFEE